MKLSYLIPLALLPACGLAQSKWEKRLAPGVMLRQEIDTKTPLVITAIRFSTGSPAVRLEAWLAKDQIFDNTPEKGRETVSSVVSRKSGLAGINGDFFQVPYNGDPLGLMVAKGEVISNPVFPRSAFGWGEGTWQIALPTWEASLKIGDGAPLAIDGLNEAVNADKLVLQTPVIGIYTAKTPNTTVTAKIVKGSFKPGESVELEVTSIAKDVSNGKAQPGIVTLVASGTKSGSLSDLKEGSKIAASLNVKGFDFTKVQNVISGGPRLVKDGKVAVASEEERFRDNFVKSGTRARA